MPKEHSDNYVTIRAFEIELDAPLPWTVYDNSGNVLLRKGFVISSERQRNALAARGIRRFTGAQRPTSGAAAEEESFDARKKFTVFEVIETLLSRLEQNYRLLNGPERELFPFKMAQFAVDIQLICHENSDAVLGAMQVDNESPYGLIHPLHVAVLCELVGNRMGMSQMQRLTLVAAAASHDIGITELQETLHRQTTPLTEEQWGNIRKHPSRGYDMLKDAGVHDRMWLDTVLNHHERIDGSGYPNGIHGDHISNPARLMAIADMYAAMIRPRAYRSAILAKDALRQLFEERGATVDAKLAQIFISEVGIFPPGAFVRLRNKEIAIVKERGEDASFPVIYSIVSNKDRPYSIPIPRDPHLEEFGIVEMVSPEEYAWANVRLDEFWPRMRPISLK